MNPSSFSDALDGVSLSVKARRRLAKAKLALVAWLRKKHDDDARARELAWKIGACRTNAPCKSLACPPCAQKAKNTFTKPAHRYLSAERDVVAVTIVPAFDIVQMGKLNAAEHWRFIRRNKDRLARAIDSFFIGAVDWTANEDRASSAPSVWVPHIHGFTTAADLKTLKRRLKTQFPRSVWVARPVKVQEWDGDVKAVRYVHKNKFTRRITIMDDTRFNKRTGTARVCTATDLQPLKSKQRLDLLLLLDEIGIAGRLFLRGVQFQNLAHVGPSLVNRFTPSRKRETRKSSGLSDRTRRKRRIFQL